jgi:hypothetical protein
VRERVTVAAVEAAAVNALIEGLFARNGGLLTRRQAVEAGLSVVEVDQLVRSGTWIAVRRGVYALRHHWESLDEHRGRPLLEARAASAAMLTPHVMSHDSAALELGMGILLPRPVLAHVTRFGDLGGRTDYGVKHHLAPFTPEQVVFVDGRPVLNAARTAADITREHGERHGLVAADSARRLGVTDADFAVVLAQMRNWPFVTVVRSVVELSDGGSDNVGETLGRHLVLELGVGRPQTQFGLTDGGRTVWCDLRIDRHIFEFDGRLKYRPVSEGGVAPKSADEILWEEKERQDFVTGFKLGMSRIVWDDLWGRRREVAKARLLREYLDTRARFGDSIDDLTPYIIRGPRPRRP